MRRVSVAWISALVVLNGAGLVFSRSLVLNNAAPAAITVAVCVALFDWVMLRGSLYPWRWIVPGFLMMLLVVIYPVAYTVYISFTNYGDGHLLRKDQAIERITSNFIVEDEAPRYVWFAYRNPAGEYRFVLTDSEGSVYFVDAEEGLVPIDPDVPEELNGFSRIGRVEAVRHLDEIQRSEPMAGDYQLRIRSLDAAVLARPSHLYDPDRDVIIEYSSGEYFHARNGVFRSESGRRLTPGFVTAVGGGNYLRIVTDQRIRRPFLRVFLWTIVFASSSVVLTFTLGLALALALNDTRLPLRVMFRSLLIVPYTIPGFISMLVWVGLMNPLYGPFNLALQSIIGVSPRWFSDPTLARVATIFINTWLGYPYMLIVSLGALQSIPAELHEAAAIDGAGPINRLFRITLPLLFLSVGPLLIGAFAFNFNNFAVIELVTQGGPPQAGIGTPAGHTDILISYTYRLAFSGGRGNEYGFASAISVIIFLIIATLTAINFRFTRILDEVSENV